MCDVVDIQIKKITNYYVFQKLDTNLDFLESKQSYLQFKYLINMYSMKYFQSV